MSNKVNFRRNKMEKIRTSENGNKYEFAAVGVTFDNRQDVISELYSDSVKSGIDNIPVVLKKEPQNPYDKNAIAILTTDGRSIGYVSKDFNELIGEKINDIKCSYIKDIYMNKKRIFNAMICIELG